jgi:hypothetical protein
MIDRYYETPLIDLDGNKIEDNTPYWELDRNKLDYIIKRIRNNCGKIPIVKRQPTLTFEKIIFSKDIKTLYLLGLYSEFYKEIYNDEIRISTEKNRLEINVHMDLLKK